MTKDNSMRKKTKTRERARLYAYLRLEAIGNESIRGGQQTGRFGSVWLGCVSPRLEAGKRITTESELVREKKGGVGGERN